MTVEQLKEKLQSQLQALNAAEEGMKPIALHVWGASQSVQAAMGDALIRVEKGSWSWGVCRSSTCAHSSHDPFQKGDSIFFLGKEIGWNARGDMLYALPNGTVLRYAHRRRGHYAPAISLEEARSEA